MDEKKYRCRDCGRIVEAAPRDTLICCGMEMVELDACTKPQNPEAQRASNSDDACDDGRAGK